MDDSKFGADYDTMTVYQMPLGVAFSGTFDTNGWKVAPMVDLSVVPTFGDKDVKYTFVGASDSNRVFDSTRSAPRSVLRLRRMLGRLV